jgi:hypothetical protein
MMGKIKQLSQTTTMSQSDMKLGGQILSYKNHKILTKT